MCDQCSSGYLFWQWSDRLSAYVETCSGCSWEDISSATQDETVIYEFTEL